MNDLKARILR